MRALLFVSRNATSYGVTVAVYTSATAMSTSHRRIIRDRGSSKYGDASYLLRIESSFFSPSSNSRRSRSFAKCTSPSLSLSSHAPGGGGGDAPAHERRRRRGSDGGGVEGGEGVRRNPSERLDERQSRSHRATGAGEPRGSRRSPAVSERRTRWHDTSAPWTPRAVAAEAAEARSAALPRDAFAAENVRVPKTPESTSAPASSETGTYRLHLDIATLDRLLIHAEPLRTRAPLARARRSTRPAVRLRRSHPNAVSPSSRCNFAFLSKAVPLAKNVPRFGRGCRRETW